MKRDIVFNEMKRGLELINEGVWVKIEIWYSDILFSWRWWLGVLLTVFSWGVWVYFRKRESTDRLLYAGMFAMISSCGLDAIGMQLKAWHYPYSILPFIPAYVPYDLALIPVSIMLLIQIKPSVHPLYKGILFGLLTSFVGEPLFRFLGVYEPINWNYFYSLPIYMLIYLISDWLARRTAFTSLLSGDRNFK